MSQREGTPEFVPLKLAVQLSPRSAELAEQYLARRNAELAAEHALKYGQRSQVAVEWTTRRDRDRSPSPAERPTSVEPLLGGVPLNRRARFLSKVPQLQPVQAQPIANDTRQQVKPAITEAPLIEATDDTERVKGGQRKDGKLRLTPVRGAYHDN